MTEPGPVEQVQARIDRVFHDGDGEAVLDEAGLAEALALASVADRDPEALGAMRYFLAVRLAVMRDLVEADPRVELIDAALDAAQLLEQNVDQDTFQLRRTLGAQIHLLAKRFEVAAVGDVGPLDRAVAIGERSLDLDEPKRAEDIEHCRYLAEAHLLRYRALGGLDDLDSTIELLRRAAPRTGENPAPDVALELAIALRTRHATTGQRRDLEAAVNQFRLADDSDEVRDHGARRELLAEAELRLATLDRDTATSTVVGTTGALPATSGPVLDLVVTAVVGEWEWDWELRSPSGTLASHHVAVGDAWQAHVLADLAGFVSRYTHPELGTDHLDSTFRTVADWLRGELLGAEISDQLLARSPATVNIILGSQLSHLFGAPLDLVAAGDGWSGPAPTFTYATGAADSTAEQAAQRPLRILALFALPDDVEALHLRAERNALLNVVGRTSGVSAMAEVTVVQYGATVRRLRQMLTDQEWDVIHLGGHGAYSGFLFEAEDGSVDEIDSAELASLLTTLQPNVRLIVLNACSSGANRADGAIATLTWSEGNRSAEVERADPPPASTGLAARLALGLRTTVIGMRFAVDDAFAAVYTRRLYHGLLVEGASIGSASAAAATVAATASSEPVFELLGRYTPVVYGDGRRRLRTTAANATNELNQPQVGTEGLLVGRIAELRRLVVAAQSGDTAGIVVIGPPGAGKSTLIGEVHDAISQNFDQVLRLDRTSHPDQIARAVRVITVSKGRVLVLVDDLDRLTDTSDRLPELWTRLLRAASEWSAFTIAAGRHRPVDFPDDDRWEELPLGRLSEAGSRALLATLPGIVRIERVAEAPAILTGHLHLALAQVLTLADRNPGSIRTLEHVCRDADGLIEFANRLVDLTQRGAWDTTEVFGPAWGLFVERYRWSRARMQELGDQELLLVGLIVTLRPIDSRSIILQAWPDWLAALERGMEAEPDPEPAWLSLARSGLLGAGDHGNADTVQPDAFLAAFLDDAVDDEVVETVCAELGRAFFEFYFAATTAPPDGRPMDLAAIERIGFNTAVLLWRGGLQEPALTVLCHVAAAARPRLAPAVRALADQMSSGAATPANAALASFAKALALHTEDSHQGSILMTVAWIELQEDPETAAAALSVLPQLERVMLGSDNGTEGFALLTRLGDELIERSGLRTAGLAATRALNRARAHAASDDFEAALGEAEAVLADLAAIDQALTLPNGTELPSGWTAQDLEIDALEIMAFASGQLGRIEEALSHVERHIACLIAARRPSSQVLQAQTIRLVTMLASLERADEARRLSVTLLTAAARTRNSEVLMLLLGLAPLFEGGPVGGPDLATGLQSQIVADHYRRRVGTTELALVHELASTQLGTALMSAAGEVDEGDAEAMFHLVVAHRLASILLKAAAGHEIAIEPLINDFWLTIAPLPRSSRSTTSTWCGPRNSSAALARRASSWRPVCDQPGRSHPTCERRHEQPGWATSWLSPATTRSRSPGLRTPTGSTSSRSTSPDTTGGGSRPGQAARGNGCTPAPGSTSNPTRAAPGITGSSCAATTPPASSPTTGAGTANPPSTWPNWPGWRWPVEEDFQTANRNVGLDQHQVRTWDSWHRSAHPGHARPRLPRRPGCDSPRCRRRPARPDPDHRGRSPTAPQRRQERTLPPTRPGLVLLAETTPIPGPTIPLPPTRPPPTPNRSTAVVLDYFQIGSGGREQ